MPGLPMREIRDVPRLHAGGMSYHLDRHRPRVRGARLIAARGSGNQSRPHGVEVRRLWPRKMRTQKNEDAMSTPDQPLEKVSDRLHPVVQLAAAGLLIWFVVAAWLLFGGAGYVIFALVMISVLRWL
jgi:hypothetical protein